MDTRYFLLSSLLNGIALYRTVQLRIFFDSSVERPVEEGHDLGAGAGVVGGELRLAGAGGDPVLHGPEDGLVVILGRGHVGEGVVRRFGLGAAVGTPEEGHDVLTHAGQAGTEVGGVGALGDLGIVVEGPEDGVIEVVLLLDVHEGI